MSLQMVGDHLWQSTIVGAAVALLALSLRGNRASVRYWLWLAASVKFLIPFAALVALGGQLRWRSAPVIGQPAVDAISTISRPFSQLDFALASPASTPAASIVPISTLMLIAWLAGSLAILSRWWLRWRQVAAAARNAAPIIRGRELEILRRLEPRSGIRRSIPLVSSTLTLEPGIFGIFKPILLWPQHMIDCLDDPEVEGIIAHEICHVRRRDNLLASIHMLVQAVFWFHPMVWWVGKRLVDERERACDENVIRLGSEPYIYAQGILKTCRFCIESPLTNVAGVTGSDLKRRIEQIVANVAGEQLTLAKKLLLAGVAALAVLAPLTVGAINAPRLLARTQASVTGGPAFEVASIKPNRAGDSRRGFGLPPGGRFTAKNLPLRALILFAYPLQNYQISGGPNWMNSDMFDVEARAANALPLGGRVPMGELRSMVRTLLADRFKLVAHTETKELATYALVFARSDRQFGPQLKNAEVGCDTLDKGRRLLPMPQPGKAPVCSLTTTTGLLRGAGWPLDELTRELSFWVGRVVVNRTGLSGGFDWELQWTPDQLPQFDQLGAPSNFDLPADRSGPSIFTALQEQLGLKLESTRGPVEVLVIDHAEQPAPD